MDSTGNSSKSHPDIPQQVAIAVFNHFSLFCHFKPSICLLLLWEIYWTNIDNSFTWLMNISFLVSSSFLTGAGSYNQTETMVCHQLYVVVSLKRGRRVKIWVKKTATSTGCHGPMSDLRHISRLSPFLSVEIHPCFRVCYNMSLVLKGGYTLSLCSLYSLCCFLIIRVAKCSSCVVLWCAKLTSLHASFFGSITTHLSLSFM